MFSKVQRRIRIVCSFRLVSHARLFIFLLLIAMPGFQSKELIVSSGLGLGDVDQYPTIDVTLDGADEYVPLVASPSFFFW